MSTISADIVELGNAVASWDGDLLGAPPISSDAMQLLSATNDATNVAEQSQPLNDTEALAIAQETENIQTETESTLDTIEAAKPNFDKLGVDSTILSDIKQLKTATDNFGAAVVQKVPADLQSTGTGLVSQIDALFDRAIQDFS